MKHKVLHNDNLIVKWEDLFHYIDIYYNNEKLFKYCQLAGNNTCNTTYRLRILGDTLETKELQSKLLHLFFETLGLGEIKKEKAKLNLVPYCAIYYSFFPYAKSHDPHCDETDLFHWQQVGKTQWIVNEDGQEYNYILQPGDYIFIPAGVYHHIIPLTPRIGVSYGFWDAL